MFAKVKIRENSNGNIAIIGDSVLSGIKEELLS